jgi:sulfur carrier protein
MRCTVNGRPRELAEPATVLALVRDMALEGKRIAVEVNGEVAPRSRWATAALAEGDRVEIVGAVGGG